MSRLSIAAAIFLIFGASCSNLKADGLSIGSDGIDSAFLPLNGSGVGVGQVEPTRPGDLIFDTMKKNRNDSVDPAQVYYTKDSPTGVSYAASADNGAELGVTPGHSTLVASVIISTKRATQGVAPAASLYASGFMTSPSFPFQVAASTAMQHIATRNNGNIVATNISFGVPDTENDMGDATSLASSFVDWSARAHDVLYVVAGAQIGNVGYGYVDNFNGITVASATRLNNSLVFGKVESDDVILDNPGSPSTNRTYIDLLAPGEMLLLSGLNNTTPLLSGTSFAAPHVTGTVALLQQHANAQIMANAPGWDADARRHEVMKAVLMNSADKLIDDGTVNYPFTSNPIPAGNLLGMTRTVLKKKKPDQEEGEEDDWFDSKAAFDTDATFAESIPLDEQFGTGHLNAKRALQQFIPGEQERNGTDASAINGSVPSIGWDYGTISGNQGAINKYALSEDLDAGSFISITLAWDRKVEFANDANMDGDFDAGDTFEDYDDLDDVLTNLDLYLVPAGTGFIDENNTAVSRSGDSPVEHLFAQIPADGKYEIWVFDNGGFNPPQDYALAWWYGLAPDIQPPNVNSDFDGDGTIDGADLAQWQGDYGLNADSDANHDGNSDGFDFLVWQRQFGTIPALAAGTSVPEPTSLARCSLAGVLFCAGNRQSLHSS